jgi:zinc protease
MKADMWPGGPVDFARARVDGDVPVFWTESGDQLTAGLVFRVGRADEVLARGGITHLIEHLALYPLGASARMDYNGQVDAVTTSFFKRGSPGEITDFFNAVCAGLRDLPIGRLEAESQVLRTEADRRPSVISDPLFIERYGADTYGLIACPEFGVGSFQADELRAWTAQHFTRGNAAMWVAGGPPPSGIRLDLPDGPAMPAPKPAHAEARTPAWVNAPVPGVGWSGLVRRSTAAQVYSTALNRRLVQELRHKQGLAYSPSVSYVVRDQDMAHVIAASDGLPEVHSILVSAFIRELERLEATGITEDDLLGAVEVLRTSWGTSRGAAAHVTAAARNAIMGRPVAGSWRDLLDAVSATDVLEVAKEAFGSSVFVLPPKREPFRAGFTALGVSTGTAVTGRPVRSADYPLDRSRLVLGEEGVSLVRGPAVRTVRYAQCAALLKWSDGGRELIGRDAVSIRIEPTLWRLKDQVARLDEMVGAGRSVTMPYRPSEKLPHPWTRWPARMAGWLLVDPTMAFLTGVIPVAALCALVLLLAPGEVAFAAVILVGPTMALGIANARLARARLLRWAVKRSAGRR